MAYIDNPKYKLYINESKNNFLKFCKKLVTKDTKKKYTLIDQIY